MIASVDVLVITWNNFISITLSISKESILSLMTRAMKEFFSTFIQAVRLHGSSALTHATLDTASSVLL